MEDNRNSRHSLNNMVDLETDSAPMMNARFKQMTKIHQESRNDSGIGSMPSMDDNSSLKNSRDDSDTVCERKLDTISDDLQMGMENMQITEDKIKPEHYQQVSANIDDEGYYSKSITDLPWKPHDNIHHPVGIETNSRPTQEACDAYMQDDDGDTQLHMAIIQLDENIAKQLIDSALNHEWLNISNNLLQTPLHLAVITRQDTIVRRLMAGGASVDVRDLHGNTPLHIASREGNQDIIAHLLKPVYYEETLDNSYEIPYQRIPQDLEAKNYDGLTCLHLAAQGTHTSVMRSLLNKGAKINAQDGKSGRTVLHYAAETGNRILLDFLLNCTRLDLDSCTYGGLTPIVLAAGRKYGDVVGILQTHGADCNSLKEDVDDEDEDMIDDFCLGGEPLSVR